MKEWYYVITKAMLDIGLRGTELTLFAILNGYSQVNDGCYYGSRRSLAERCGVGSTRTIDAALKSLIDKGLVKRCTMSAFNREIIGYMTCAEFAHPAQNLLTPCAEIAHTPCAEIAHNNKDIDNKINNKRKGFAPPTIDEVKAYCAERKNNVDAEAFVAFYASKGWKVGSAPMHDWRSAVITWEKRDRAATKPSTKKANYAPDDFQKYYNNEHS